MSDERKRSGVAFCATAVLACLLPVAAYFVAYAVFVQPAQGGGIVSLNSALLPMVAWYPRLGDSSAWETFFAPAHWVDRRIRPKVWHDVAVEFDLVTGHQRVVK